MQSILSYKATTISDGGAGVSIKQCWEAWGRLELSYYPCGKASRLNDKDASRNFQGYEVHNLSHGFKALVCPNGFPKASWLLRYHPGVELAMFLHYTRRGTYHVYQNETFQTQGARHQQFDKVNMIT